VAHQHAAIDAAMEEADARRPKREKEGDAGGLSWRGDPGRPGGDRPGGDRPGGRSDVATATAAAAAAASLLAARSARFRNRRRRVAGPCNSTLFCSAQLALETQCRGHQCP
jgi:hypothetical protein